MRHFLIQLTLTFFVGIFIAAFYAFCPFRDNDRMISYTVDTKQQQLTFYSRNPKGELFKSIQNLRGYLEAKHKTLVFAMNGGMYAVNGAPLGLYIEDHVTQVKLDTGKGGRGNFYMKPNGVFYLTSGNAAKICQTQLFKASSKIKYATQSGPMLVIDGVINPKFTQGSVNVNIRNGVGILPNNKVVFALSRLPINFYDFALYFKELGCEQALYLDGAVSRMYLPEQNWLQTDGDFGVIMAVTK